MLPTPPAGFIPHLRRRLEAGSNVLDIVAPFKEYEGKLRELYAQEPENPVLATPHVNLVPLFEGHEGLLNTCCGRELDKETPQEKERYMLSLDDESRRAHGSPAVVQSLEQFNRNFAIFSEQSLAELDWNNVVAAGSSVLTPLLPVPEKHNATKRDLRNYYHEELAPASDVDLFLYGLNEEQAIEKIKQIESCVRNSILEETTCVRTKNTITIVSKYPVRHVQIVLRLYSSISEILTGFDVDCACVAYDGSQIWATPRAVGAMVTQINTVDLTRRSPSYENRLAKYRRHGFEVYWPDLDRSKIDPTIFERSFASVVGLARLLVMERLPSQGDREDYLTLRLMERGGREKYKASHHRRKAGYKNLDPEEVAEWEEAEDVSNYHTCVIPYGPDYHAKKIVKLLYKKDMLLNAEWNKPEDREVHLHRHPAFFGRAASIINDCCRSCPQPLTDEETKVAEEESKWFISGNLKFVKDNPGRQAIGSFNPITDSDWTEMAYLSDNARLCQAIVDGDVAYVQRWCDQKGTADKIDSRDHTGRTPLHLAAICGNLEIVKCLIDRGAGIVARVEGGFTALHIAAHRGHARIVEALIHKSEENRKLLEEDDGAPEVTMADDEEEDEENDGEDDGEDDGEEMEMNEPDEDASLVSDGDTDMRYATTDASFVNIEVVQEPEAEQEPKADGSNDPDIYDLDVVAWDIPVSPLHLAIMHGHGDIIDIFASTFGADFQLPVWLRDSDDGEYTAVLPLSLPLGLPPAQSLGICKTLLELGVSSAQADTNHLTALHAVVVGGSCEILDLLFDLDGAAAKCALNHPVMRPPYYARVHTPLAAAVRRGDAGMVRKLLQHGADCSTPAESFEHLIADQLDSENENFRVQMIQPVIMSVFSRRPDMTRLLIDSGADPNALETDAERCVRTKEKAKSWEHARSLLDLVSECMSVLDFKFTTLKEGHDYLAEFPQGSYARWLGGSDLEIAKLAIDHLHRWNERIKKQQYARGLEGDAYVSRIQDVRDSFAKLYELLRSKGAKPFNELHPDLVETTGNEDGPPAFKLDFTFSASDKRDFVVEQHKNLFEAAWSGDAETVKALTFSTWGPSQERPLHVSVKDRQSFTPLAIAVLRGDIAMVNLIMDIANLQYTPSKKEQQQQRRRRNRRLAGGSGSDSESDDDDDDHAGCGFSDAGDESDSESDPVAERTTVDVREIPKLVPSRTRPLELLQSRAPFWRYLDDSSSYANELMKRAADGLRLDPINIKWAYSGLIEDVQINRYWPNTKQAWTALQYAVEAGDDEMALNLLELGVKYAKSTDDDGDNDDHDDDDGDGSTREFRVRDVEVETALRHGRIDVLNAMISKTGVGLPFQKLLDRSGVKVEQSSKVYQGLLVDGKKRHDWAKRERRHHEGGSTEDGGKGLPAAPILRAVFYGNLEAVKWILSDEPRKQYLKYAKTQKHGTNIEGAIISWWNTNREHAVYSAVLSKPSGDDTDEVARLKLILDGMPQALNLQDWHGQTPLQLAFSLRRISAAKHLIDRGADQTLRSKDGANILHSILVGGGGNNNKKKKHVRSMESLTAMFDLVDPDLIPVLATQRMRGGAEDELPTFNTPLAAWLDCCCSNNNDNNNNGSSSSSSSDAQLQPVLREILRRTNGAGLRIPDGRADYPIHHAIKFAPPWPLATELARHDPEVLHWENGTGSTPLDILDRLAYQRGVVEYWEGFSGNVAREDFDREQGEDSDVWARVGRPREKVRELGQTDGAAKRKLVSVSEANELVRRLEMQMALHKERKKEEEKEEEEDELQKLFDVARDE